MKQVSYQIYQYFLIPPAFSRQLALQSRKEIEREYIKIVSGSMTYRPGMSSVLLLSHKKKWNGGICNEVDGVRVCHTEWS